MGGDRGPSVVVEGAVEAAKKFGTGSILIGDQSIINSELAKYPDHSSLPLSVHHTDQVIGMDESPGRALKNKPNASICVAFELAVSGKASAVVGQGNTGAIMAAGVLISGTLPGIARPAIASLIPKANSSTPTVLIDSGANSDCQASQLVQFALMGRQYAMIGLGTKEPRIALLANGTESSKGTDVTRSAAQMLSELDDITFIGYVEGRDIGRDVVDVVACDGFVGNIVLKAMEGTAELVFDSLKQLVEKSLRARIGLWMAKPVIKSLFKEKLDPSAYGGAPLLGLHHVAIKCHGSATSRAIMNGINVAKKFVDYDLVNKMAASISALDMRFSGVGEDGVWTKVGQRLEKSRRRFGQPRKSHHEEIGERSENGNE